MDSLHPSLSQALPPRGYDADQVLQAPFRAAALGIATFYKKAAENGRKAYSLGYSSALQDVLEYLQAGLDHGTDSHGPEASKSHRTEQWMALTIERVMDYIERRQDAIRAESQEISEDDGTSNGQTNPPQQPPQPPTSTNSNFSIQPTTVSPNTLQQREASSQAPSLAEAPPPQRGATPNPTSRSSDVIAPVRRTSPRRAMSANPESVGATSEAPQAPRLTELAGTGDSLHESPTPPPSTLSITAHPINLNFSSFTASPLPHHQYVSGGAVHPNRRHRGGTGLDARKGKSKDRTHLADRERSLTASVVSNPVQFDPMGFISTGYAHYATGHIPSLPSGSSESGGARVLTSIGNKRRFPIEQAVQVHDPNALTVPKSVRKPSLKNLNGCDDLISCPTSEPICKDDVMMVLDQEGLERPSKRNSRRGPY